MFRTLVFACGLVLCFALPGNADDSLMRDYIKDFSGRWVCETVADNDIEGYWSKGDELRFVITHTPTNDMSGVRYEWHVEKDGEIAGKSYGLTTWDPKTKCLRGVGFAMPGFLVESTLKKNGDTWIDEGGVTYPDGSKGIGTDTIHISDDGKTHTNVSTKRVDNKGETLPDLTVKWHRVSENHEMLEKHLGWLIGTWTGEMETVDQGLINIEAKYKWIANGEVITLELTAGKWENLSMILYDTSDGRIKMWGANSAGGNGQAVMRVEGDELVWTNSVFDGTGKRRVRDFAYIKKDDKSMYVRIVDQFTGKEKTVLNTKK